MDPMSREILTNPNFDFSTITWENAVTMITFWRFRFATPTAACRAWINILTPKQHSNENINRMFKAILNDDNDWQAKADFAEISYMWTTKNFKRDNIGNVGPLEDFDEFLAAKQHGHWSQWALDALK
jgi:hypothetical protein